MLKASANYPKGYPVPLCDVMMIVLLVLDDLVTLPGLPPLKKKETKENVTFGEVKPSESFAGFGFSMNVKTIRDFPHVSGRNALLIFLSKIERMERIVPHFAWHSDTNYQIIINRDNWQLSGDGTRAMIIAVLIETHDIICRNINSRKREVNSILRNIMFPRNQINVCRH